MSYDKDKDQIATGEVVLGDSFRQHRITGFVKQAYGRERDGKPLDPNLDVELISHVEGGLWQGGCPDYRSVDLPAGFDYVLSMYPWGAQYGLPKGCERDIVTAYDSRGQDPDFATEYAQKISAMLDEGKTVLVHCQAGLNRSGLVAARTLILRGSDPSDAISLLRSKRDELVLSNEAFEKWLLKLEPGT